MIELLIVVAIIGILAAIAVPNFIRAQVKAKISRVQADHQALSNALELYFLDWNSYVEDHDYPTEPHERGFVRLTTPNAYIGSLPHDPFPNPLERNFSEANPFYEFGSGNPNPSLQWPNTAYLIISAGPDLVEEVQRNDEFPVNVTIWRYDISNGLYSGGDIIRMGGNYTAGRIRVDGEWFVGGP